MCYSRLGKEKWLILERLFKVHKGKGRKNVSIQSQSNYVGVTIFTHVIKFIIFLLNITICSVASTVICSSLEQYNELIFAPCALKT